MYLLFSKILMLTLRIKNKQSSVKSCAIQFTGEDANIYKIENIAKINYKAFKIHRTKDRHGCLNCFFSLKGLNKYSSAFSLFLFIVFSYLIYSYCVIISSSGMVHSG
jgi:hypothetical protein